MDPIQHQAAPRLPVASAMPAARSAAVLRRSPAPWVGQHLRRRPRRTLASTFLVVAFILAGTLTATSPQAGIPVVSARAAAVKDLANPFAGGLQPGIQYEQAMQHAHDVVRFAPGGPVTVGFTPRAGDRWLVNGHAPVALPPASASQAGPTGVVAPVDQPAIAPGSVGLANATSAALPVTTPAAPQAASSALRRQVYGFLPYWELGASTTVLNYDLLSTIAYFGVGADQNGNLIQSGAGWSGWTSSALTSVINAAHTNHTRVDLTVEMFAWTTSQASAQLAFLQSSTAQNNLATQIASAVKSRGVDGVNLDFEPIASGGKPLFTSFVKLLRQKLNAVGSGYSITICTTGYSSSYDITGLTAAGAADAVFIMGYDYRSDSSPVAGSIAPLQSPTIYDLTDTIRSYLMLTSASKIILGLPYYGRAWSTPNTQPNAANISSSTIASVAVFYDQAAGLAATNGRRYDSIENSAWTAYQLTSGTVTTWRELYYDDAQSLGAKYDMINSFGLRGSGIWALGYDGTRPELWQALASHFLTDTTPPLAGVTDLPPTQTDEGFLVSWKTWDDWTGIKSTDVQVSVDGGAWSAWLTGTSVSSAVYVGNTGHGYAFRVRATDGAGNVGPWNVTSVYQASPALATGGFGRVAVDGLNVRSSASTSASVVTTVNSGTIVAITGGPVTTSDGYTWYQVTLPITEWAPTTSPQPGLWVAASGNGSSFVMAAQSPNATAVSAGLTSYARPTVGWQDGPGGGLRVGLSWSDALAMSSLTLNVYRQDGSLVGSQALGARGTGAQAYTWNGSLGGSLVPAGTYVLQLTGVSGTTTYHAPSAVTSDAVQWSAYAVAIDPSPGTTYVPLTPARLVDTRIPQGMTRLTANVMGSFQVTGQGGVPAGATAVTGTLTVTAPSYRGYVVLANSPTIGTSTINFTAGQTIATGVTVPLTASGQLDATFVSDGAGATTQLIFDVTGYLR